MRASASGAEGQFLFGVSRRAAEALHQIVDILGWQGMGLGQEALKHALLKQGSILATFEAVESVDPGAKGREPAGRQPQAPDRC